MDPNMDMSRLPMSKGHPNAPVTEKEIDTWVSRIDDVSTAISDFLQSDPDDLERRREARRKEIAEREREYKKKQIQERYDVAFYRKYEDDKFIDDLLDQVDKNQDEEAEKKKKAIQVSKEHQMSDFEKVALEEARKTRLRANEMVGKQNYVEAHELYSTIISLDPDDDALVLAAHNNRALTALKLPSAKYTQVIEDTTFVIKQESNNVKARLRRAAALLNGLHRPKDAIEDLRVVLRCDSSLKDAKDMMITAQREAEETDAADKVGTEDPVGCEKFSKALDSISGVIFVDDVAVEVKNQMNKEGNDSSATSASTSSSSSSLLSKLEKTFEVVEKTDQKTGKTVLRRNADSDVSKFCREVLENLVVVSEAVSLDDAFSALFRLKNGFKIFAKLISTVVASTISHQAGSNEVNNNSVVPEAILLLSASLRILSSVLNVDRTATAFFATSPEVLSSFFEESLTILKSSLGLNSSASQSKNIIQQRLFSSTGAALSLLSHIINNHAFESVSSSLAPYSWKNLSKENQTTLLSAIEKSMTSPTNISSNNNNNNNPLLTDAMSLNAAIMLSDEGAKDLNTNNSSSKNNKAGNTTKLVFSQLDSIASQKDYASPRSKSTAMMLLRVSSKQEFAEEIGKNLDKLLQLLSSVFLNETKNNSLRFGILAEGLLSAILNACVLQVFDRQTLAKKLLATGNGGGIAKWLPVVFTAIFEAQDQCVTIYSSVVSKLFSLLGRILNMESEDAQKIMSLIVDESSSKFFVNSRHENSSTSPLAVSLSNKLLDFINEQREIKAKKLADSEQIKDVEIVRKTADQWLGTSGVPQITLLEKTAYLIAAVLQASTTSNQNNNSGNFLHKNKLSIQLSKLCFRIIDTVSTCAPMIAGNAAMWMNLKLVSDPEVLKYWSSVDEKIEKGSSTYIESPKARAEKIIKILLTAAKNISSQMFEAEKKIDAKSSSNTNDGSTEQERRMKYASLNSTRRNVAVVAAKLCAVEGGLFVEEFRSQGGTQLFGSLKIS